MKHVETRALPPKFGPSFSGIHGVISPKTEIFFSSCFATKCFVNISPLSLVLDSTLSVVAYCKPLPVFLEGTVERGKCLDRIIGSRLVFEPGSSRIQLVRAHSI
jgi:hypothetical protein